MQMKIVNSKITLIRVRHKICNNKVNYNNNNKLSKYFNHNKLL